ncbi:clip-associating protein [Anaeramoeba ignava]|uniref:Clip-associating protein n=1 Tax=Anaeramoeba ignava TaxID=1746090 RepID=A0A9Q0LKC2_ANAIG|nr:clip-associating protein [Anaeramoeba ignava]|eukprot:Anaeramoba_ignava/a347324_294.p1 GENE.a347324_294~~a347324_294.p1  ORF type:complete len:990 (-),score=216.23 a347324_294:1667-4636(-)
MITKGKKKPAIKKTRKEGEKKPLEGVDWSTIGSKYGAKTIPDNNDLENKIKELEEQMHSTEWETRKEALIEIHRLLNGNEGGEMGGLWNELRRLRGVLTDLIGEERSAIVKHACYVVSHMSRLMKNEFAFFFEGGIFTALNKRVVSSIQIIAESATICTKQVIKQTTASKIIPVVADVIHTSRSSEQRECNAEYMRLIIRNWDKNVLDEFIKDVDQAISDSLADAREKSRRSGRLSFWEFSRHFPSRCKEMFLRLDQKTRAAVLAQKHTENNERNKLFSLIEAFQPQKSSKSDRNSKDHLRSHSLAPPKNAKTKSVGVKKTPMQRVKKSIRLRKGPLSEFSQGAAPLTEANVSKLHKSTKSRAKIQSAISQVSIRSGSSSNAPKDPQSQKAQAELENIVKQAKSDKSNTSSNALLQLLEIAKQEDRPELVDKTSFRKCLSGVIALLSSPQSKIRLLSVKIVRTLVDNYTYNFQKYLQSTLAALIPIFVDKKDNLRDEVRDLFDLVRSCFGSSVLIPSIVAVLEKSQQSLRPTILDLMLVVFQEDTDKFFDDSGAAKSVISTLRPLAKLSNLETKRKLKKLVQIMAKKNPTDLNIQISALPLDEQKLFSSFIRERTSPTKSVKRVAKIKTSKSPKTQTTSSLNPIKKEPTLALKSTKSFSNKKPSQKSSLSNLSAKSLVPKKKSPTNQTDSQKKTLTQKQSKLTQLKKKPTVKKLSKTTSNSVNAKSSLGLKNPQKTKKSQKKKNSETTQNNQNEQDQENSQAFMDDDMVNSISALLMALTDSSARKESLRTLITFSEEHIEQVWDKTFAVIVFHLLNLFIDEDKSLQDDILSLTNKLVKNQSEYFKPCTTEIIRRFLEGCSALDESRCVSNNEFIYSIIDALDPVMSVKALIPFLSHDVFPVIFSAVSFLAKFVPLLSSDTLNEMMSSLFPPLKKLLTDSSNPEIRRVVIFTFVEFFRVLGKDFQEFLKNSLDQKHLRLIHSYLTKDRK